MVAIEQINALLPQTQCGQCSFKGCQPYAEAIATGLADINQCPPGGDAGIQALAELLGVEPKPLNPEYGVHKPKAVAFIVEQDCIGCVKCIAACPVDAIVGANKFIHTVISAECTGCELCIAPCPVECIVMQTLVEQPTSEQKHAQSALAKRRYEARLSRKAEELADQAERARQKKAAFLKSKSAKYE